MKLHNVLTLSPLHGPARNSKSKLLLGYALKASIQIVVLIYSGKMLWRNSTRRMRKGLIFEGWCTC